MALTVDLHTAKVGRIACHTTAHVWRKGGDGREQEDEDGENQHESRVIDHLVSEKKSTELDLEV